ncbi:MAG: thermonuclease family protein [Planctomycetota bacterium]|nr:thermonuclease family protein [Planctomycetota bacterium]
MKQKDRPVANGKPRRSRADKSPKNSKKSAGATKSSKSSASRNGSSKQRTKGSSDKVSKSPRSRTRPAPEEIDAPKKNWSLVLSVIAVVIAALALVLTITTRNNTPNDDKVAKTENSAQKTPKTGKAPKKKSDPAPAKKSPVEDKSDRSKTPKEKKPEPKPESKKEDAPKDSDDGLLRMEPEGRTRSVKVIGIIDGDTLRLFGGEKVRLIGINTPEKNEPLCPEATDLLKKLLEDKDVTLAFDKEEKDRYGRSLAFVYAGGVFVNGEIIRQGLAYFYEFKPNVRYSKLFLKLQRQARAANRNLWAQKHDLDSEYFSSRKSARFHRANCKRGPRKSKVTFPSRNAALDTGRSPCPDCKS